MMGYLIVLGIIEVKWRMKLAVAENTGLSAVMLDQCRMLAGIAQLQGSEPYITHQRATKLPVYFQL